MSTIKHLALLAACALLCALCGRDAGEGYRLRLEVEGMRPGDSLSLAAYRGQSLALLASTTVDEEGRAEFAGENSLPEGMYIAGQPGSRNAFSFLISDKQPQRFTVNYNAADVAGTIRFKGSPENSAFMKYLEYPSRHNPELDGTDRYAMLSLYVRNTLRPPEGDMAGKVAYLSNITFNDGRITRMPVLEERLNEYFFHIVNPYDTAELREAIDHAMGLAWANAAVGAMAAGHLYRTFRDAPLPDHKAMAAHIGRAHILADGRAGAFDQAFVELVRAELDTRVGTLAQDLAAWTADGRRLPLSGLKARRTVVLFADPECDACRATAPGLMRLYEMYRAKGLEVYSVYLGGDKGRWTEYNRRNNINWTNVWLKGNKDEAYAKYDIWAIPTMYLLDEGKRVLAQDIMLDALALTLRRDLE